MHFLSDFSDHIRPGINFSVKSHQVYVKTIWWGQTLSKLNSYSLCVAVTCACLALGKSALADVSGIARVIDGDTIEVTGRRIRLHGIDAPERKQTCKRDGEDWSCGLDATRALNDKIGDKPVRCEKQDRDRYRRISSSSIEFRLAGLSQLPWTSFKGAHHVCGILIL